MGDPRAFISVNRQEVPYRDKEIRIKDYSDIEISLTEDDLRKQASRCIDCGIPFCHGSGCTLYNKIPDWNDYVYKGQWELACKSLHSTNNFPEFTGKVCPALCEAACTLNISDNPVLIRHIEFQIAQKGFEEGWIRPVLPQQKTDKKVAVIGSGPAGMACAQELTREGHQVTLFEKNEKIGGLLRYGIPDFKLEKSLIDRRVEQMIQEGLQIQSGVNVGKDISAAYLSKMFDVICLGIGAGQARQLAVNGSDTDGVYQAMDFLSQQNKRVSKETITEDTIWVENKKVVVIGGGDTGSDCVGTAIRQGASRVTQIEIMPKPPEQREPSNPWPLWPKTLRTSSSHKEGCIRMWGIETLEVLAKNGKVCGLRCHKVKWSEEEGKWSFTSEKGSEFEIEADYVFLAMGFVHPSHAGIVEDLNLKLTDRGNILINKDFQTSNPKVFAAGDSTMGASLVLHAIYQGRQAAASINNYLKKN